MKVKAEVIFLTHNAQQHDKNLLNNSKTTVHTTVY
jgi:hypothetical protein